MLLCQSLKNLHTVLKERLDKLIFLKGLVKSRELASALIMEGRVLVDGKKITKPGTFVSETADIILEESTLPYVSRGGLKLEAAINFFRINVNNKIVMDVGSSTGGFTDCLLKMGAKKVYCIDVGYGQLDWSLRNNPKVILLERTNIRYLNEQISEREADFKGPEFKELIQRQIDMASIDVSFISLTKVIPVVIKFMKEEGEVVSLVKPQFEVGKGEVGKGGIVKDEEKRLRAVKYVKENVEKYGLKTHGIFQSPVTGHKGNIEYFLYMKKVIDARG